MKIKLAFLGLFFAALTLVGCEEKQRIIVQNATIPQVATVLRDYVGLNGFRIRYTNESPEKASYGVFVGKTTTVIPGERETTYSSRSTGYRYPTASVLANEHERTERVLTQETPAQSVSTIWNFNIQLYQRDQNVEMVIDAKGGFDPAQYAREFLDSLRQDGFTISISK